MNLILISFNWSKIKRENLKFSIEFIINSKNMFIISRKEIYL